MPIQQRLISIRNHFDFTLRQMIRWSRGGLQLEHEPKEQAFSTPAAHTLEKHLLEAYDLEDIRRRGSVENYRINLYYLDLLEKVFDQLNYPLPQRLRVADIGCSTWFYVRALRAFLLNYDSQAARDVQLYGYEVDAFRPYFNFYSRLDYVRAYSAGLKNTHFIPDAFKTQALPFDMITQFFPFIFIKDHLEWGLPGQLFSPAELLQTAWSGLRQGGLLLIVNQGEQEHVRQKELLSVLGVEVNLAFCMQSPLCHYEIDHYVLAVVKNA